MLNANHFHFFIKVKGVERADNDSLSSVEKAFKDFFISYAKAFNKKYNRTGSLFQYKFKRKLIEEESYFTWLIYYIHANPIASSIVKDFSDWPFSSYSGIIKDLPTSIDRKAVLDWFYGKDEFIRFHKENIESIDRKVVDKNLKFM